MSLSQTNVFGCHCARLHFNHSGHCLFLVAPCTSCAGAYNEPLGKCVNASDKCPCMAGHERINPSDEDCVPECPSGKTRKINSVDCEGKKARMIIYDTF